MGRDVQVKKKKKEEAVDAHWSVRRQGFHIFLGNRLTNGGEVPKKIPGTRFC
jgi:hypothetical protein